jgi:uncharacterized protein (TIGR03000 family)
MFRKSLTFGGILLFVVAVLVLTVSPVQAASRPARGGYQHRGYYPHHNFYPHRHYWGFVIPYYVPYYNYVPYYVYNYVPYYVNNYVPYYVPYYYAVPYYVPSVSWSSAYTPSSADSTTDADVAPGSAPAHITVKVPANAEVWFDGEKTTSTGTVREFNTPPLKPGVQFTYDIQARWEDNGRPVTQSQRVTVSAGSDITVTFPMQPGQGQAEVIGKP